MLRSAATAVADDDLVTGSIEAASALPSVVLAAGAVVPTVLAIWALRGGRLDVAALVGAGSALLGTTGLAFVGALPFWVPAGLLGAIGGSLATHRALAPRAAAPDPSASSTFHHGADGTLLAADVPEPFGADLFARVHLLDRVAFRRALDAAAQGVAGTANVRLMRPDGAVAGAYAREARPARADEEGAVVSVWTDAFAEHDLVAQLERAVADAEAKDEAKDRFLAATAHEFRTPLNAVIGFADLLRTFDREDDCLAHAKRREYADLIHTAGHHLLALANDLVDAAKVEAGAYALDVASFPPGDAVREALAMLRPIAAEQGVRLADVADRVLPEIEADRRAVLQIVVNLLANAVHHAPEGSTVTVGATERDGGITLTVSDLGPGMSAADLDRIGRPFVQLGADRDRAATGAGLGFSIVRGLVELHGGTLAVRSVEAPRPGHGTDVTVYLPLVHAPPRRSERVVRLSPNPTTGTDAHGASASNRSNEYGRVSA